MHTPPGDPRQGFPPLFSVAARKVRQQVCTPTGRADNPTWAASSAALAAFPGASISLPERGPPRLYHVAKSVLSERGRHSAEGWSGKEKRGWWEELRKEGRCQCLDIKEKHPTSFSGVSSACRRSSLFTTTIKLETPAPPSNPSSPKGRKNRESQGEDSPQGNDSLLVCGLGLAAQSRGQGCWRPADLLFLLHTVLSL